MIRWFLKRQPLARQGEAVAARHLRRQGYTILGRNVRLGRYEIDLIAQEGDTIAFVEVKTRRDDTFASPEDNVTGTKQHHLRLAARQYIARQRNRRDCCYRFDVVSVLLPDRGKPTVTLYRDAFRDE